MDNEVITSGVLSKEIMDHVDEIGKCYQELTMSEEWVTEANYALEHCIENLATIVNKPFHDEIERMKIEEEIHLYIRRVQSMVDVTSKDLDHTQQTICDGMSEACSQLWSETDPKRYQ
jgi:glutamate-1-semialdehyde aminotransferase